MPVEQKQRNRILYWDMARGITILMMMVGHFYLPFTVKVFIYSFHMPLFFISNAYFMKSYAWKDTVIKSAKKLLIPYAVGTGVEMICEFWKRGGILPAIGAIRTLFIDFVGGMCQPSELFPWFGGTWVLWFLPCLFLTKMIYIGIMKFLSKYTDKWYLQLVIIIFVSYLGVFLSKISYFPWGLEIALISVIFMYFGDMLHKYKLLETPRKYPTFLVCLIVWTMLFMNCGFIELARHYYPNLIIDFAEACAGTYVVVFLCTLMEKVPIISKAFAWIGRNSIIILVIHNAEMRYFGWGSLVPTNWKPIEMYWKEMSLMRIAFVVGIAILFSLLRGSIRKVCSIRGIKE